MRAVIVAALATSMLGVVPASAASIFKGHAAVVGPSTTTTTTTRAGRRGGAATTGTTGRGTAASRRRGGITTAAVTPNVVSGVTLCTSPGCVQPGSNVLFDTSMTGTSVNGTLNDDPAIVTFTGNESLTTTASNGQARISGADGNLTQLTFGLVDGATFNEVEFNLNALADGFVTLTFLGTGGTTLLVTDPLAVSLNGQNYFGGFGSDFSSVTISSTVQLSDVRQVRLGGITTLQTAVPEASTWAMMLLGFGAAGYGMRKSRRRSPSLALATA